jgi:methionyl-tRNA formyltransferase
VGHRVVFLGTPSFAVPSLAALLDAGHIVVEVVTQPDRPKGRKQELAQSAVKQLAVSRGIPVFQPERARRPEAVEYLRALKPDLMVVVGYGQILPQSIIDIAPLGIINVHASLLPKLRGAAPVQWSLVNGDRVTGVTTMQIDAGLDTGAVLLRAETEITPDENAAELALRLSHLGAKLLVETVSRLSAIVPEKQDAAAATLAPILNKDHGRIDWTRSALEIHNQVRGLIPWPGAYTTFRGQALHIWKACVPPASLSTHSAQPGTLMGGKRARIACGDGTVLEALEVQVEGRKRIRAADFMNGLHLQENEVLGAA